MATPTWVNLSTRARGFSTRRGRQFELDRMQTGTASCTLANQDRALDPNNAAGPYYPNVVPVRKFKIEATWNSVTYPVFIGYVEDWPQTWQQSGKVAEVSVPIVDGFAPLGYAALTASYPAQLTSARIGAVLNDTAWSATDRTLGAGHVTLQASVLNSTFALEHLQSVVDSEAGYLFMGKNGNVTFIARLATSSTILATFGDGGGAELPYSDLTLATSPILNDVRLTAAGGVEQISADTTSQARYFKRSRVEGGYLTSDLDVLSVVDFMIFKYKDPHVRVTSILLDPQRSPTALWPIALGLEIGDHVIVKRRPPGGGAVISQESVVEGIEHLASPYRWQTRLWLSAADTVISSLFMILDSATAGRADVNTVGF